jgi:hypothetical protein
MGKAFKVVAVTTNTDADGLAGHVLVARDGQAFEVVQSRFNPVVAEMRRGEVVEVEMRGDEPVFPYPQYGETTVSPILRAPPKVVEEAWKIQPLEPLSMGAR